jgi:ferredoxin-type protein NapH
MNIVTDMSRWLRRKLSIRGGSKLKRETRYFMLAAVLITAAVTGVLAYELVNPVSLMHRGIIFGFGLGWVAIIGIFAFDLLFAKDGWCGHLCPMGALYGLIGTASIVRVRADARDNCDDCMECYEVCPEMHVIPAALKSAKGEGPVILSSDCTNCGRCIDVCDEDVYHFGLRFPNIVLQEEQETGGKVFEDAA